MLQHGSSSYLGNQTNSKEKKKSACFNDADDKPLKQASMGSGGFASS